MHACAPVAPQPPHSSTHCSHRSTQPVTAMQCNTIQHNTMQYNTMQCNAMQCNTIQYNTMQYNTIQYNAIQYNTIKYNTIQYNTIQYTRTWDSWLLVCAISSSTVTSPAAMRLHTHHSESHTLSCDQSDVDISMPIHCDPIHNERNQKQTASISSTATARLLRQARGRRE